MNTNLASIRQSFGQTLLQLAKVNKNIWVVDADLKSSLALSDFATRFPERFIECGVAENNAAGIAAGLAKSGKTVFLTSFACFSPAINWAVIKQSICLNNVPVIIVGSHAGLMSGDLGSTHQMLEDIALMRALPNMEVFAPLDAFETTKMVTVLSHNPHPSYLRLVRPSSLQVSNSPFTIGKSTLLRSGKYLTVCGYGPVLTQVLDNNSSLDIINCSSIKPLDETTILKSIRKTHRLLVIEEHQQNGGLGEALAHLILSHHLLVSFSHLSLHNQFGQSAKDYQTLWDYYGIGPQAINQAIQKLIKQK